MRGALAKTIRKQAEQARNQAIGVIGPAVQAVNANEETTRKRVDALEVQARALYEAQERYETRLPGNSLGARLRWLISGK